MISLVWRLGKKTGKITVGFNHAIIHNKNDSRTNSLSADCKTVSNQAYVTSSLVVRYSVSLGGPK